MFPILQIGPLAIQFPGLLLLAGVWVATLVIERSAPRNNLSSSVVNNMIFYALIAGVLGARLGYVLQYLEAYVADPLSVFALNPSTLSFPEGLITGVIVAVIYGQRNDLPLWPTLDALTPGLAIFRLVLGLAHLSSGDAFGAPANVPWALELWGAERHPSQVYEVFGAGLVLLAVFRMRVHEMAAGFSALYFIALSAGMRLFLEAFRGDSVLIFAGIRQAQLLSLLVLLAALIMMHLRVRTSS
jgi:prolipoprotein diacylglyceryl transferase